MTGQHYGVGAGDHYDESKDMMCDVAWKMPRSNIFDYEKRGEFHWFIDMPDFVCLAPRLIMFLQHVWTGTCTSA